MYIQHLRSSATIVALAFPEDFALEVHLVYRTLQSSLDCGISKSEQDVNALFHRAAINRGPIAFHSDQP